MTERRTWRPLAARAAALALALALGGCMTGAGEFASTVTTNVVSAGGLLSSPVGEARPIPIFVASTRKAEGGLGADSIGATRYGLSIVTAPPGHAPGVIEQPSFGKPDPRRHFTLARRRDLDEREFAAMLATHISGRVGAARDVLVYVHGFNTSLAEARLRLAQIVEDSRFAGVPVLYSWPSRQKLLAYGSDRESATAARDALEKLLRDVAGTEGVGRVHVLAHSMGTWVAMEALRQNAIAGRGALGGRLGEVMLAAPDLDLGVFEQQMARLPGARVSVLATTNDRALSISQTLAGRGRLGNVDVADAATRAALERLGVKVYDITDSASGLVRHGAFAEAPQVVAAIGARLAEPRVEDSAQAMLGEKIAPAQDPSIRAEPLPPPGEPPTVPTL
ncbi:MAG: alpha/beta fold hydrolase [Methylobacteriaceae bacterium]|nr:alpha/beta fold hydrolase [Methylobacteriaceae bacterium]